MNSSNANASSERVFRSAVVSVVKHDYVPNGMFSHPRFRPVVVTDDADQPEWVHERNQKYADQYGVPYVRDIESAISEHKAEVAIVSPEAERHCDLSIRAANLGCHIVQDKPMSTQLSECDRLVHAIVANNVRFLMWNRNALPAIRNAAEIVASGRLGTLRAVHIDFYFAKDAGPPIGSRKDGDPKLDWLEFLKAAHVTGADGGVGKRPMGELEIEGIYPLGYLHLLTRKRAIRVFARTRAHFHQLYDDNGVDDLSTVTLEMEGGLTATLCLGRIGNASHPDIGEIKLHLIGTDGSLVVSEARPEVGVYYREQPALEFPNRRIANEYDWLLADDFAQAIDRGSETLLGVKESRAICATVHAAIESGKSGTPVAVKHAS